MPKLKEHPKLSSERRPLDWPPGPSWATSGAGMMSPEEIAESVLVEATWQPAKGEDHRPHVRLRVKTKDGQELGYALMLDDTKFLRLLASELRSRPGLTLEELGEIELP